jgi:DNA (cytosine-5)-methyltransferase 1
MEKNMMNTQSTASRTRSARSVSDAFRFDLISTFSGCGGSSLGYKQAGGKVLLAIDNNASAVATYRTNFPDTPVHCGKLEELSVEEICRRTGVRPGELHLLDSSPCCQAVSTLGDRCFEDDRNQLFFESVRLLRGLQPMTFILENVPGLVKGEMRFLFVDLLEAMKSSGYDVKARVLNAKYFHVPQDRRRVIFVGVRKDLAIAPSHPRAQSRPQSIREALGLRGEGMIEANNQFHTPRRNLDETCMALTRHPPILLLDGHKRELTVQECATLSGFPADWKWGKAAYRLIGNAVPPPFMKAIAEHVRDSVLAALEARAKRVN